MVETATAPDLGELNAALAATGYPFKLAFVPTVALRLLDKNARFMPHEMFANLVANVKRDGGLSQLPFCWFDGRVYHVLSGNHRVKAAKAAKLESILVLYDDRPLSREDQVAIQLSHNSISGRDDPAVVKELWAEIDAVELKYYAGLDDKLLKEIGAVTLAPLSDAPVEFRTVTILFLPDEADRLQLALDRAAEAVTADEVHCARYAEFGRTIDAMDKTKTSWGVTNNATALALILDIFESHLDELASGWCDPATGEASRKGKVPLASVLGDDLVNAATAARLRAFAQREVAAGRLKKATPAGVLDLLLAAVQS